MFVTNAIKIPIIGAIIYFIQNGIGNNDSHMINENINAKGNEKLKLLIFNILTKTSIVFNIKEISKIKKGIRIIHKALVIFTLPNSGADSIQTTDSGIIMNIVTNKTVINGL